MPSWPLSTREIYFELTMFMSVATEGTKVDQDRRRELNVAFQQALTAWVRICFHLLLTPEIHNYRTLLLSRFQSKWKLGSITTIHLSHTTPLSKIGPIVPVQRRWMLTASPASNDSLDPSPGWKYRALQSYCFFIVSRSWYFNMSWSLFPFLNACIAMYKIALTRLFCTIL